jgi:hypothetical protein
MPDESTAFFSKLETAARARGMNPKRKTATGWNVHSAKGGRISVTTNYAPTRNRVSVKLTIAREKRGGPTPMFDAVEERFKKEERKLSGDISWERQPPLKESKIEVERRISDAAMDDHVRWAVEQALVLREWAAWAASADV